MRGRERGSAASLRRLRRRLTPDLAGAIAVSVAALLLVAAFVLAAATGPVSFRDLAAASGLVVMVAAGLLYAWALGSSGTAA